MSTYCRITGKSRGLPKPNYFPLLPPISPADAKRFCRITGKSYGLPAHHYIPVLVGRKKKKSDLKHVVINGYRYVFPIIDGCSELSDVLKTKCTDDRRYVYSVDKRRCSLVFPTSLEKAVRDGDVKDVMMSETSDTVLLKLRKGKTVELEIKEMEISGVTLMEGEGFRNRPKQKKTVKEDWRRKIFEDKEKESDAELEQEELKSKRITFSAGQGKQIETIESIPKIINAKSLSVSKIKNIIKPTTENIILGENNNNLKLQTDILPTPISIEPNVIDLGSAFPGVVHQTFLNDTVLTNLPIISVVSPIKPLIKNFNKLPVILPDINSCAIEEILTEDNINKLLTIDEINVLIENIQLGTQKIIPTSQGTTKIFKLDIKNCEKYVPGQYVKTEDGEKFVPGKIIDTANGKLFVHGVMVQTSDGAKFLPGQIIEDSGKSMFIVGQNIITREGESFVPGQTITIEGEKRFVPGQTVKTPEGIGFVAGQVVNNGGESDFIPGQTVMTIHGPQFVPGQFWNDENIKFTPGQSVLKINGDWEFVPGVCVGSSFIPGLTVVEKEKEEFIPGRIVETDNDTTFIPGITTLDNNGNTKFVPGISIETENGIKFVSGNILSDNDGNKQFILGHVTNSENGEIIFTEAKSLQEVICSDEVQSGILTNDSFYPKGEKSDEVFGQMVQTAYGVEFYPDDQAILPAGKIVPGKLIRNNGIRFVPGVVVDNKFIPGQIVVTDRGEQFVPGQVIETQMGPKFVPGQVVETETGSKFVPGQTIETKDGIKFVPGQIVETKAGLTFIPGQIIFTEEEGSRFVPGQVVDTIEGPRFVPGRVVETGDCVTFVPGQVVETTEGLKFIAPDLQDADDGVCEFSVQGFEVSPEELQVIQPNFPQTSYYTQNGKMALDSKMLEQLSFAGMSIGRQVPAELPEVDVRTLPSMEVAYDVAEKLEFNNDNTIKLAHIINRLCKLDLKNTYYGSPLVQNLINKLPKIKTNENVAEVISNLLNTAKSSPITALNEIYVVIFDDGFVTDLKNPNKVNILKGIMNSSELESKYIAEAFSEILNDLEDSKLRLAFEHIAEENIELLKEVKLKIDMKKVNNEKEAIEALQWAIVSVINKNSEITVNQMLKDNKSEQFNRLLSDAVGLAKALGLKEVASVLMDVLDDRRSADILASDKITIEILRRLTVMRKLAERRPEFSETLNGMSIDPIEARLDPKLRELVRESGVLLLPPESNVETSFDVPAELFSPGNSLAMEDFMVKSRKMGILLIIKNGLQAVVPREAARSVLTGQVPYTVLDERGMHRFEPMNVLDVLNIRAFSSGRYSMYNCAVQKTLTEDEGTITRGSSISLDDRQLTIGEGGGDEYEVLQDYETEPVDGADEEDDLILEPGDRVVVLKQSKDDPSMGAEVKRNLLLDNAAAKHKMSVRPNKVHPTKHKPLDTDGSLVQSLDEPTKMGYVPNSILKKIPAPVRATAVVPAEGQTLSKKDAKFNRDVVLAELVETEEEFGQDIQEVVERYLNPLELNDAPRIVRDNKDLIFNNLKQISQFHNTVLIAGLKYAASEPKTMGRTFLRLERDFDKHVNYCQTEPEAQDFLECNYQVRDYFEDERLKVGDDKALSEHLKLPIQRINDYQLLLKELVKYSLLIGEDTTDLERALELMLSIPHRFTDTKFLTNIEGFHGTIHKLGRLLKHGWYYVQDAEDPKGHQRYCFLFKSRILVCKVRRISEDKSVFVLKDIIRLPEVTVKAAPDNKRVWVLHHRLGEVGNYPFTFRANEDLSRDQWITEIEEHRNDLLTNVEHNSDDIKVQKQKDEDLFEPLKGIELDISKEIEEGLDPIERRLAPKPLKHVEEPKRPPLTLPPKEPIFECTSPPEPKKRPEPEVKVEEPPVIEMPVPNKEVIVEKEIKEEVPVPQVEPIPTEPPPPERSPSPAEEEIESEPLKYVEGVSKPYFHVNIKGTNRGGVIEECNEWWDTKGEFKSGRSMNNESSLAVGENATFECEIEGATKVTWLKNNMPLPNTIANRTSITEDKENNLYKLQLNKVIMSDSGTYTVKAENDLGESTSTALLFVENLSADEKKARAKANAPIFAVKLADTQLLENTHARFMIEIKANPLPKLRFFKGDKEISDEDTRIQILEVNKEKGLYEMVLPNVKQEDAGEYRVIASNKYSEESCSCHVSVTSKQLFYVVNKVKHLSVYICLDEKDLWAGMQTIVPDGTPHFTWLKNGKPFNPEERFKVLFKDDEDSLALVFQNVKPEDAGLYTCIASTCHGKISCSAELSVQGVVKELNLPYAPRVTTDMKEFETKIQSTAILEAKVIGDPLPDIIWFKNDEEIQENERIKFMFEDEISAIVIKNVEVEDEGEYKVLAKNDLGSDTETINLLIKAAPKFRKNLIDYEGVTGKEITLSVEIEASPKPIVQWYKDSKVIKKSNRIKYVTDEVAGVYTLIIQDCKMEDVGLYSVVASNQFSQISDACRINLQMPPQFIGALAKEVETLEGDYVSLSVRVEGDPPPQVKWYFEDKLLIADKTHIKINAVEDVHTLLISNLTREDSGKYTCEISNEFGKNTSEGKLLVKCPPIFETPLTDTKAIEGDTNVEFTVKLNSYPKSSVQWFREEEEITETTTEFTCFEDGDNFKLIIKEAKTKLAGTYKCRATNEIGTYDSEATLTVMSQPTFKKGLRDMEVTEGGMLKLQVTCYGSPAPEIKWFKDGKEVRSDAHIKISKDKKRVENFSLTVNLVKVEDGGEYEVRATNEMGTAVTKSIVNILAKHSTDFKEDDNESTKNENEDIEENLDKKEKVTLPIKINSKENCRERLVEINVEEDRKIGISSIINIDGDRSIKTEESLVIMSSQSGEFSCVEMSWEESSTKCRNYYGIVEEPRDERIIPIKIDRSISIHTASDEEEEPFWVVESVKKHEEVRNEIKKMKENKNSQQLLGDSCDEDDDNSLIELLKRVQKQRNDLENILEKENQKENIINPYKFEVNRSENILSRSNSMLSESSTLKARSVSRLSSLEENTKMDELSETLVNELISNNSNTCINSKKETSLITENTSKELISDTIYNTDRPKKSVLTHSLYTETLGNSCENSDEKYSKDEGTVLTSANRASISRLSSIEECDNSFSPKKNIRECSEIPKRLSLSRLPSTEHAKKDFILEKSTSPIVKENELNKDFYPSSFLQDKIEYELTKINDTLDKSFKPISEHNLNESISILDNNDDVNNINNKPKSNYTKALDNDKSNEYSPFRLSKADEADFRRKSLIRQSSMISDALSAMCAEIPEDNKCNKQKRYSIKEDNDQIKDSYSRKSSFSKIVCDENNTNLGKKLISKLDADREPEIHNESFDSLTEKKLSEISSTEPLKKSLLPELNKKIISDLKNNDLTTTKADSGLSNYENKSFLLDKENNLNNEKLSVSNSLPKDNNLDIVLPKDNSLSSDIKNSMNDLKPNASTLFKGKETNNLPTPILENLENKEGDIVKQSSLSLLDKKHGNTLTLATNQKGDIACNNNTDLSPSNSLSLNNIDSSTNITQDLNPNNSVHLPITKEIIDTNVLNMPMEKLLINKESEINNDKTGKPIEKVDQIIKEHSPDGTNKENENISKLKTLKTSMEENNDKQRSGVKQIGVPPKIISGMDDDETYESLTKVFNVKARGAPKPKVQWFKDGNELSNTRNIQINDSEEDESFKLTIQDLRVADSGSYCCKLTNEVGEDMKSAKLNVQDVELLRGPKIRKPLSDIEVIKGQKVEWSITLIADPIPEVEWTCDGKNVNADFTVNSSEIANGLKECTFTMTIPTSELSDTGLYRVKATNKFDSAECSAHLDIVMKPEIEGFHDITVIPSMEAIFEAIIHAVPKPKIVWTINGKDLSEREFVKLTSEELEKDITKFKIVIGDVNPEEEGEYVVKAWNKVGETTAIANLKLHTEEPSFVKLMEDLTIQEYDEVQLSVRVNGIPKPKITWFKNGEVIIPDLRISIHTNEEGQVKSTLTIDHFSGLDIAKFSVKAVNMMGEAETSSNLTMAEIMPSFVKPFERITEGVEGSPIEIQTQLIGSPRPHVAWYKDGEELKNTEGDNKDDEQKHITLEANPNGTVMIKIDKVEQGDCGAYKIIATNNFGTSATNTALVVNELPKKPILIKHPNQVDVNENEILKIEAQYVAYPDAIVKWYKDGHVLHPCPQIDFVMGPNGNVALVIEKATLGDAGDYEIVVSNELGKADGQIKVKVNPAATVPAFIMPLRDSKVVEGFPAKLPFRLSGFPLPEIAWTINDKPLVIDGEKIKMAHEPDGLHYLLIEKAGPEHAGKLAIIASNNNGNTTSEAKLSVTSKINTDSLESKPEFLHGLKDTTVEESNALTLLAPFLGNPIPDVKWEKDGKILQPCNKVHFTCDGYKVGLEILDTNTGDAGQYTCTLTNNLGATKSECQVGIRKLYQAPVFTQRFSHNQQLLSRDAKFHARVTGVPSPNIIWHKNGHQLTNGDKYKLKRDGEVCSLTISDVNGDDAGLYSCIATNRDGTATCEAQLSIAPRIVDESRKQEPPSFMKKIGDCEVFDGMTAKFTACATGWPEPEYEWFLDTNRLYETERIRMEKEGSGLLRLKILHADSIIDSGRYKLRIFNPHGEAYCEASILFDNGLDSRSKRPVGELYKDFDRYRATGAPLPLPDPPTITRMSDKRLTLSWKPSLPITPRTPVTYLVEMEEQPKGEWTTVRAGIRGCACDIHNLIPFRDYKFRVRVENNYGISDPSPFVLTYREKLEPDPPKFTPYLPIGTDFKPESSPYFPRDFDIERPPHDNYAQAPRFLHQEHDTQYGVKGHNVNLYWFVYGYPKPKMQYYFDNQLIEMGGRYDSSYTRNGQATLFINKMLDRDIGTYEAVATNEHGIARQRVRLQIAEYPKFLKRPEEMYVILRKNCKLEARVIGVPYPEIKWFKDWKPLVDSARIQIEQVEPDVCILRIEDVIMKDEGLYSISARNLAGSISTSVAIHVEDRESDYSYNGKTDIKWKKKDFSDLYDIGDELGRGTQGVVYHAVERSTGRNYAAKVMHAKGDNLTKLMDNELKIMTDLSNRRIIRIHDALQTSRTYTLITELAGGGELLDILTKHSFLTEYDIALYIIQLLKALKHMHDFEIAHLGLTPGDLLISHPGGDTLKLCDFGLSRKINRRKLEPVYYGMPEFISPEIAKGEGVDLSSDMWSVGVITHLLLTGMSLFRCVNDADTLDRVKSGSYTLSTKISDLARDFISKLLIINPNDRLDVISALQHPWLQFGEDIPAGTSQINTDSLRNYYNNLKDWYSNASCRNWYRCHPLSSAYTHPSKMIYPPGFTCTPSPTPEPEPKPQKKHLPSWKDKLPSKEPIDTEIGIIKSESHYQYGPDTYLLQLRDTNFPVRLREYMKVAGKSLTHRGGSDSHLDWEAPVIRERRKFTDIMDEEIEDEQKARISKYGADIYTLRRLKQEIGSRPTAHVEAEAILESRIDGQPPFFREKPQKLPVEPDKPADLMCLAVGVPKPLVQWFKNDIVLTESHRIKMLEDNDGRSILRLDPATELDLGIYKVVARNKFGQTTARARLVLAHEPGPMEAPIVKEYSDTEILLRWDHPKHDGNAPILCYQLEVRENESEWELVAKNIDHEFWLMQNLRPYTNYEFRLAAMNHIAWGPTGPSSPIVRTHFPDAQKLEVPSAMLNLQIITESGREIIGDEPRNNLDYSLEYKPIDWAEQPPIEKYRFISEIARGRFSVILKGINTSNDSIVVAKLLEITPDTESRVTHEFNVLKSLKHERIAYLLEAFKLENAPVAVFIQEKLQGADILTYLSTKENYSEQTVATIVTQVLDGLQYLHWRGYAHLDLQPDNIVMASVRTIHIKLIDFGCAQKVSKLGAVVGANSVLEFTAPEILCDEPAYPYSDIWSLGVIAYTLLSGMSPFRGSNDTETRQNITFVRYRFEYLYKDLSQEATRFLMLLFKRTPTKRPSAEECHEHRWLLPTEYMIKKREKTMFNSYKLQHFAKEYHENRTKFATSSQKLLGALGTRQIGLGRSNSVVDELLIFK
ncbi:obscurin isoform X3 [Rhopalosiphum padi]|uniref:obscurin isoform X3 n=1 Tax=Rhopalosiphum padi TaxID=40932 RepID=UPI00298E7F82|nr:obscurin isoform X3 [Rhopalosiphum padi]